MLEEALGQGHCGMPRTELAEQAATLLGIDAAHIEQAVDAAVEARALIGDLVDEIDCLFLPAIHQAENEIADALRSSAAAGRNGRSQIRTRGSPRSSASWACSWPKASERRCAWRWSASF